MKTNEGDFGKRWFRGKREKNEGDSEEERSGGEGKGGEVKNGKKR